MLRIEDIILSISNPMYRLSELGDFTFERDNKGELILFVSSSAVVFKVRDFDSNIKALKCYTKSKPDLDKRFELLKEDVKAFEEFNYPSFSFFKDGVMIPERGELKAFDVLISDWIDGETVYDRLYALCEQNNPKELYKLTLDIAYLFLRILNSSYAHGDIKPANIIISNHDNVLYVIDWDGMYHNTLEYSKPFDIGTAWYNHPDRGVDDYNENMDCYAMTIIIVSLLVLSYNPTMLKMYADGEKILLSPFDIINNNSELFEYIKEEWYYHSSMSDLLYLLTIKDLKKDQLINIFSRLIGKTKFDNDKMVYVGGDEHDAELLRVMDKKTSLYGFVDRQEYLLIDTIYGDASIFSEGYAAVRLGRKCFYIDEDGFGYEVDNCSMIRDLCCGMACVKKGHKWGFWSVSEKCVSIDCLYDMVWNYADCGIALVQKDSRFMFIDKKGNICFEDKVFTHATSFSKAGESIVSFDGESFYKMNVNGNFVF